MAGLADGAEESELAPDADWESVVPGIIQIVAGRSPSEFDPCGEVNRAQGAVLLSRMTGISSTGSNWQTDAVDYLYSIGAISDTGLFDAAVMLRQQEISAWLECMRDYYTPQNLHFEVRDGVGYLDWDGPIGKRIEYFVYMRADDSDGDWFCMSGTNQTEDVICEHFGSNYGYRAEYPDSGIQRQIKSDLKKLI